MKKTLLALALVLMVATTAQAEILLRPEAQSFGQSTFFATGQPDYFRMTNDLFAHTNQSGWGVFNESAGTISLHDIGFTRPAHSYDFEVSTVRVQIEVDAMRWELPYAQRSVVTNIGQGAAKLTMVPFSMSDFVATGAMSGRYTLTGFNGTVRTGSFNFGSTPPSDAPVGRSVGRDWNVHGRTGNPLIGPITGLDGSVGETVDYGTPGVAFRTNIFGGVIDGINFELGFIGQGNHYVLSSRNSPLWAVPEPSAGLLLSAGSVIGLVQRRR